VYGALTELFCSFVSCCVFCCLWRLTNRRI